MDQNQLPTGPEPIGTDGGEGILGFARELGQVFGRFLGSFDSPKERWKILEGIVADPSDSLLQEEGNGSQ